MIVSAKARQMMVDCQIKPSGVIDESILDAFASTPREHFLQGPDKAAAYVDRSMEPLPGRPLMCPADHARLLSAAKLTGKEYALDLGTGCGYGAAILSSLCETVVTMDTFQEPASLASGAWKELDICNIVYEPIKSFTDKPNKGPYDVIIINGTVSAIPENIASALSEKGRLLCIMQQSYEHVGHAILAMPSASGGKCSYTKLFESGCGYLEENKPQKAFAF